VTASQRGKNSPRLVNEENEQSNKHYHARGMTWAQRLKRVHIFIDPDHSITLMPIT
jgi:hypothetical protein